MSDTDKQKRNADQQKLNSKNKTKSYGSFAIQHQSGQASLEGRTNKKDGQHEPDTWYKNDDSSHRNHNLDQSNTECSDGRDVKDESLSNSTTAPGSLEANNKDDNSAVNNDARDSKEEYEFIRSVVPDGFKFKANKSNDGSSVNFSSAIKLLKNSDPQFLGSFLRVLKTSVNYKAYFFETPPMTLDKASEHQFEFVLINCKALEYVEANPGPFRDQFRSSSKTVVAFPNIGKDGIMVAPCPQTKKGEANLQKFTHLAAFVRGGEDPQVKEFWRIVGKEMEDWLRNKRGQTVWLSTSGLGVYWLHMRLDSYPKYYTHHPYRNPHSNV